MTINFSTQDLNVYRISYQHNVGTCFLYGDERGTIFITAKHIVQNLQPGDNVLLQRLNDWAPIKVAACWHARGEVDISIFASENFGTVDLPTFAGRPSVRLSDQVAFLGFPHGLANTYPSESGFSTPLVKLASFSGVVRMGDQDVTILDGINNPGFSGGPVYANKDKGCTLLGVISGYRHETKEHSLVYRLVGGVKTPIPDTYVTANSGMIYATSRGEVEALLSKVDTFNPIKPK